ncbi:MAG: cobalamin-dependent protein, partial [Thermodesulfobacteriota bacterium]|nr:cobalamin-dependent protein [Thermodesulfobacteriota bacterium]
MGLERITLITPPSIDVLMYGDLKFEGVDSVTPPLNLLSLAAYISQSGFTTRIVDGYANRYSTRELLKQVAESRPDVVGITCTTPLFLSALEVAQAIKKSLPDIKIIVGGPHITALPEDSLTHECFDVGVIGEGEITLRCVL